MLCRGNFNELVDVKIKIKRKESTGAGTALLLHMVLFHYALSSLLFSLQQPNNTRSPTLYVPK